jgi:O-antigen/teichoic acid export membrane protein
MAIADQGLPRFFIDAKDEKEKTGYVATAFFLSAIGVLIVTVVIIMVTPLVPLLFKDIDVPILFTLLIALLCFTQSFRYAASNMLKWTFKSPLFAKITLSQTFVGAVLTISGIIMLGWRAKGVLVIGAFMALGAGTWAYSSVRQYIKTSAVSKQKSRELAAYSWPLLGLNIFAFFSRSLDRIFLGSLASLDAVGIFSVSSAVAGLFGMLVSGFFVAWGPYLFSTFRETWAPQRYAQFFSVTAWIGVASVIGLGLWGGPVVALLRSDAVYQKIGVYIPWIITGTLLYYLGGYFTPGPVIAKKTYWKLIGFAVAATGNAALNYVLIPPFGVLGAGIATAVSSLVAAIFQQIVSNRLFFVPNPWKFVFFWVLLFATIVSAAQIDAFAYNINSIGLTFRALLTVVLLVIATIPFYEAIKTSGFIGTALALFKKRVQP